LYNLGNTCFMNAALQALFNTAPLRRMFTKDNFLKYINRLVFVCFRFAPQLSKFHYRSSRLGTLGVISAAYTALVDAVWSGLFGVLRPQQFLETFQAEVNALLVDGRQHDAQEFQIFLLNALHEDTNRVVEPANFEQNYTGANLNAEAADFSEKMRRFSSSPVNDIFSNPGYTGLYNLGNTCFMNAALQALFNTAPLRRIRLGTLGVISAAYTALVDAVWSGLFGVLRPQQFLETFQAEVNALLVDGRQHDAQEFQIFLLNALHEDTNRCHTLTTLQCNKCRRQSVTFEELTQLSVDVPDRYSSTCHTLTTLQCNKCRRQSVTFEELTQLSVDVPDRYSSTVEECIRNYFRDEELDGSCKWRCSSCETLQTATRRTFLWKLPQILVIHLKRFSFVEDKCQKNDSHVKFSTIPLQLQNAQLMDAYYSLYAVV
uniref:ubiquitinyl hydrolase 1 n=1 Tax=Gongylonema pulchrum TaxID=637853 RepID=A0A183EFW4_9BILA